MTRIREEEEVVLCVLTVTKFSNIDNINVMFAMCDCELVTQCVASR